LRSYEPELNPAAIYKLREAANKASLSIHSTGKITVIAPSVRNIDLAVKHIYPLVYEFRSS
jgi:transcription initiation factor TFIID TATA-box-binding protein